MKALWPLVFLAVCAVLLVTFQAIKQEANIRATRKAILLNTEEVTKMEREILTSKTAMQKLSSQLAPLDKQKNQLTKKMEELVTQKVKTDENLNTCQKEKKDVELKNSERASTIESLKTNQNAEIQKVQEEVQSLQKQILDRDTNICSYVDKQHEEGRKLCMDKMGASNV